MLCPRPKVAIERCAISASQEEVNAAVAQAVEAIGGIPQAVRDAKRIMVKPNYVGIMFRASNDDVRMHKGRHAHNTDPAVCAAAIKLDSGRLTPAQRYITAMGWTSATRTARKKTSSTSWGQRRWQSSTT